MVVHDIAMENSSENINRSVPVAIPHAAKDEVTNTIEIGSPSLKAVNKQMVKILGEEGLASPQVKDAAHSPGSPQSDEEPFKLPDGSPTFSSVMHELQVKLTCIAVDEPNTPISPLALNSENSTGDKTESTSPKFLLSPNPQRKRITSASTSRSCGRSRSMSWNARNQLAAERRKAMQKIVPRSESQTSSTSSSPLAYRKSTKSRTLPNTPKIGHVFPKYKFPNESVSVSHEDIVREQNLERHLMEGFHETKSIFDNAVYKRYNISPDF